MSGEILNDVYEPPYFNQQLRDLAAKPQPLPTGDYAWFGATGQSVGIERKEIVDLLNSFANGRLTDQLRRMVETYDWPILLIEGYYSVGADGMVKLQSGSRQYKYTTIQQILFEAELAGMYVTHSPNKNQTVHWIRALYEFSQKKEHTLLKKRARPFQLGTKVSSEVFLLMGLPGVGEDSARALLDKYGSPLATISAIALGSASINGFGPLKLERAKRTLLGESNGTK